MSDSPDPTVSCPPALPADVPDAVAVGTRKTRVAPGLRQAGQKITVGAALSSRFRARRQGAVGAAPAILAVRPW